MASYRWLNILIVLVFVGSSLIINGCRKGSDISGNGSSVLIGGVDAASLTKVRRAFDAAHVQMIIVQMTGANGIYVSEGDRSRAIDVLRADSRKRHYVVYFARK